MVKAVPRGHTSTVDAYLNPHSSTKKILFKYNRILTTVLFKKKKL